jgi:hypothetical protein
LNPSLVWRKVTDFDGQAVAQVIGLPVADRAETTLANSGLAPARRSGRRGQGQCVTAGQRHESLFDDTRYAPGALAHGQERRAPWTEWDRDRGGMLPALGARAQPASPGYDGSAILAQPNLREWAMPTQPVYRASVPVADVCLQAKAFLVRRPLHSPPKPRSYAGQPI